MTALETLPLAAADMLQQMGLSSTAISLYEQQGAKLYARLASIDRSEIPEILSALRGSPKDILELAAGSGRLSIPLACAGHRVVATDNSSEMLRYLRADREKLPPAARDRLTECLASMEDFDLDARFDAILIAATSISLVAPEALGKVFQRARQHLRPDGRFLLTLEAPGAERAATHEYHAEIPFHDGTAHLFSTYEYGASNRVVAGIWIDTDGKATLSTSQPAVHEMSKVVDIARSVGFEIDRWEPMASMGDNHAGLLELVVAS